MPTNDNANRRELPGIADWQFDGRSFYLNGQYVGCLNVRHGELKYRYVVVEDYGQTLVNSIAAAMNSQPAAPAGDAVREAAQALLDAGCKGKDDWHVSYAHVLNLAKALAVRDAGNAQVSTQNRDPVNGQYAFDGDMERLCKCGHKLGAHIAGGFECGTNPHDYPETRGCACEKFKPPKKAKPAPVTPQRSAEVEKALDWLNRYCGAPDMSGKLNSAGHLRAHIRQLEAAVPQGDDAWTRGAEAMREAAAAYHMREAKRLADWEDGAGARENFFEIVRHEKQAKRIRNLPIPPRPGKDTPDEKGGAV